MTNTAAGVMEDSRSNRPAPIRTVGVVGAGTMGGGIAQKMAMEGANVILVDQGQAYLDSARKSIEGLLEEGQKRKVLRPEDAQAALGRMKFSLELEALKDADLVIEAIYEDMKAKTELFSRLDGIVGEDAVFATNTSSLSVTEIARATQRPARFVGLHYFYHPVKNRLVEVVGIEGTEPAAYERVLDFSRATGKIPIEVKDSPGFAVNRFFVPWLNEAVRLEEEGIADRATIDKAAEKAFGIGMGPFALMNATKVPIAYHAAEGLRGALGDFYAAADTLKKQADANEPWTIEGDPDPSKFDAVAERLWGVVFWVAASLVEEGAATREDADRGARIGLRWSKGPFEAMNRKGVAQAAVWVRAVCGKYGLDFPKSLQERVEWGDAWSLRYVDVLKEGNIARIVLNRPETMNALDETLVGQLAQYLEKVQADESVSGIILEGRGKAFVAGADVKFFVRSMKNGDLDGIVRFTELGQKVLLSIEASPKPVVAVIDGMTLGGGFELALACRARVATPKALFRLPETSIGIYPGLGGTQRLPRAVGKELGKYFIFTGSPITSRAALELGLVDALKPAEEALDAAKALSLSPPERRASEVPVKLRGVHAAFSDEKIADLLAGKAEDGGDPALAAALKGLPHKAPRALAIANELIDAGFDKTIEEGVRLELGRLKEIFSTEDAAEGLGALLEGRRPVYKGK